MTQETEIEQVVTPVSPGALLKTAREQLGISQADIAKSLNLKTQQIQDLENDLYSPTVAPTFTRGYLRVYARHVRLPEQEVLAAYDAFNTEPTEPSKLQSFSRRVTHETNDNRLMLVSYAILAGLVGSMVLWWVQQSDETVQNELPPAVMELVQDVSQPQQVDNEQSVDEFITNDAEYEAQQSVALASATLESTAAMPDDSQQQSASVEDTIEPVEVVFTFANDCWMEMTDASGEKIAYGTKKAGRVMPVRGQPPFQITLGSPNGVTITYDGAEVDMSRFPSNQIAKIELPLQD